MFNREIAFLILSVSCFGGDIQKFAVKYSQDDSATPFPVRQEGHPKAWLGPELGPVSGLKLFAREKGGAIWLGGEKGAARFDPAAKDYWERWQYFAGRRWLADDFVQNIWIDESGGGRRVWIRDKGGISLIEWRRMLLGEKAESFESRIEVRHVRHGFVSGSTLKISGDLKSNETVSSDNDGLWTGMYLAAEAFRYAVTKKPDAKAKARRSLLALFRLEEITGTRGFSARSFIARSEHQPGDGQWHPTADGQWIWKGDTSSDELVGHYFAYAIYYDLAASRAEKMEIATVVSRLTDHLIEHDYNLIDLNGQPTRWGQWSENYFKTEEGKYEAPLRSLELLSFLKTSYHITGNPKYMAAYQDRVARGYAKEMTRYRRWDGGGEINFSDDELAYLSYYPLLQYETDATLRRLYLDGLKFTWKQIETDRNPLWNFISAASGLSMSKAIRQESILALTRIPNDLIEWDIHNAGRLDIQLRGTTDRFGVKEMARPLPPDERPINKWNSNPYRLDSGGSGNGEDDGAFFLLPYWMGRYYHWVKN